MSGSPSEWELSKENIQPLKQGRKMSSLRSALCPRNDEKQLQKQAFEDELRTYSGEDPLEVWYSYILWVEQNYPKGGKEGNIGPLVERCVITFSDKPEYCNDNRFTEIWIKYANMHSDALDIYDYMYSNNIGCGLSIFYENWAWVLENIGNFKRADAVLSEGIQRKAQPLEALLTAHRHLQLRVGNTVKQKLEGDADELPIAESRSVLCSLRPYGKKNKVAVNRIGSNKLDIPLDPQKSEKFQLKDNSKKQSFKIHNDENSYVLSSLPHQSNGSAKLVKHIERTKENDVKPKKWPNAKILLKPTTVPLKQTFEIYEDEECAQMIRKMPLVTNVLSSVGNWKVPVALFEPHDHKKVPMYDKNKVYAGGEEFSFEEIRSARWFKKQKERKERQEFRALQDEVRYLRDQISSLQNRFCPSNPLSSMNEINTAVQSVAASSDIHSIQSGKILQYCSISIPSEKDGEIACQPIHPSSEHNTEEHNDYIALSNNSSLAACHISTADSQQISITGSPHMKEAMSMLRGVWYQSGFDDGHTGEDLTKIKEVNDQPKKFGIYKDPTLTIHQLSIPPSTDENIESVGNSSNWVNGNESLHDNNAQNEPPEGYFQEKIKRPISGILQPSIGILVEEQNKASEEGADIGDDGIGNLDNVTVNVEKFAPNSHLVSTPFQCSLNSVHLDDNTAPSMIISINEQRDGEKHLISSMCSKSGCENCGTNLRVGGDLSVISEGSCECYSNHMSNAAMHLELSANHLQQSSGISAKQSPTQKLLPDKNHMRKYEMESSIHSVEPVIPTNIDPFSIHITQNILSKLSNPLFERSAYIQVNETMPVLRLPRMYQLGKEKYVLLRRHAQGGYAKIYVAQHCTKEGKECTFALKVSKPLNEWEYYICSELWERLCQIDANPVVRDSIIFIESAIFFKDGVILVSKFGGYGTLIDVGNLYKKCNQQMPECLIMCFTLEMLHIIHQIHHCKIIHADVKPDNFLVINLDAFADSHVGNGKKCGILKLIDFGRSIDMEHYPPGTAFTTVVNTSSFKCIEMLEGKPWTYQADWFGVLGTIHTLLFAEYMKVQKNKEGYWEISNKFKRYWQTSFWQNLFHTLLNIPGCDRIPDVAPFINELTKKLQEPSMANEIKKKAMLLYDLWSESNNFSSLVK